MLLTSNTEHFNRNLFSIFKFRHREYRSCKDVAVLSPLFRKATTPILHIFILISLSLSHSTAFSLTLYILLRPINDSGALCFFLFSHIGLENIGCSFWLHSSPSQALFSLDAKGTIRGTYGRHWNLALQNNNRILLLWKKRSLNTVLVLILQHRSKSQSTSGLVAWLWRYDSKITV